MTTDFQKLILPAIGYYELGMFQDSYDELEKLPPELKTTREVLSIKADILTKLESWKLLREVSRFLVKMWPNDPQHLISHAFATRRSISIVEAEKILLEAVSFHADEPIVHFNLACYAAQQARLEKAAQHLGEAIKLDPQVRKMALDDKDLEPLWGKVGYS